MMVVRSPGGERGIALVIVLWVVVLLTVIASSFIYDARTHTQLAGNLLSRARAQALADAGVHRSLYELVRPTTDDGRWKPEGRPYEFDLGGGRVTVNLLDESAYIDLNAAPEALLLGLMQSVGVEEGRARELVDAIQDWRDADDLPRTSGAERDQYQAAGLKYMPANTNFRMVEEIKSVLGMTPDLYARISGALTVHSGVAGISSSLAPRQVLLAIPNVSAEQVDAYLAARQGDVLAGLPPPAFPPAAAFTAGQGTMVYNARSQAVIPDGTVFVREAVVRLTGDPKHPFGILNWREGRP